MAKSSSRACVSKTLLRVEYGRSYGTESSQSGFDRVCVNSVVVCPELSQVLVESETGGVPKRQLRMLLFLWYM